MDHVLNAQPGEFRISGSPANGRLGAGYTGRQIDVGQGYAVAKQWLEAFEASCTCPLDGENAFLAALESVPRAVLDGSMFRGRFLEKAPTSPLEFGPPPPSCTRQGRYNYQGEPLLYLCSSLTGVTKELGAASAGFSLWVQRFHIPAALKILDATRFSQESFAASVFWVIESHRDRSIDNPPRLGASR